MALITRTYHLVSTSNSDLLEFVAPTASIVSFNTNSSIKVQIDNAADTVIALDEYMALQGYFPGAAGNQAFTYTATGSEGQSFDIALPVARTDTSYIALVVCANQPNGLYMIEVPVSGYSTTTIHVNTAVDVTAGDKFVVLIQDLT